MTQGGRARVGFDCHRSLVFVLTETVGMDGFHENTEYLVFFLTGESIKEEVMLKAEGGEK